MTRAPDAGSGVQPLPIDPILPAITESLRSRPTLVLEAPPGAGKTTRVPRVLLDGGLAESGEIVVLEPRRLAARLAARRVAEELGESVGRTVGYQVRFEDVSSEQTRIRFVTEGVLGRKLIGNPELRGVSAVVLDEFHERHLTGDVALALVERLRRGPRPDLRIIAMSATLAAEPLAAYLDAPVLRCEGRRFEVAIDHLASPDERPLAAQVASALRRLSATGLDGDVLIFLPGAADIRQAREACERIAADAGWLVLPLHGDLPPEEQDRAVRPGPQRKVILATNVAESSITIEGVVAVVDSGLARVASQAPWSGLPRLRTEKISRASAVQRAGRAGRTAPGRCMRLYTRADFDSRAAFDTPEIRRLDLAQTCLEIATLGASRGDIRWLEPPPEQQARAAGELLERLGAVDSNGEATQMGREMLRFAVHPRIARVLVEAMKRGSTHDACVAAAILSEGDIRASSKSRFGPRAPDDAPTERSDISALVDLFREAERARFSASAARAAGLDVGATYAAKRAASQLERQCGQREEHGRVGIRAGAADAQSALGLALLAGYPDRVAKRVRAQGRQLALAAGGVAELAGSSVVREAQWLVALDAEEQTQSRQRPGASVVVRLASAIEPEWLLDLFPEQVRERREVQWNAQTERVEVRETLAWGGLVLHETLRGDDGAGPAREEESRVLAEAALALGPRAFAPDGALDRWLARVQFAATLDASFRAPDDEELRLALTHLCEGRRSFAELRAAGLLQRLRAELGDRVGAIDRLAPERLTLTSGRSVLVRYERGKPPSAASRLQDFFGMRDGPRLGGRIPLVLELLAPNGRAVQVTADLAGFWQREYPRVRRALMRRYPKHAWPENPNA
jgi:ATP-dependent RNA helicase HrpB